MAALNLPILHDPIESIAHGSRLPEIAEERRRHRTEPQHRIPFEFDFQSSADSVISKAPHPCVVYGTMLDRQRIHQMIAIHNPVPTNRTPMSRWRVVIDLAGNCFVLAAAHPEILPYGGSERSRVLG